MLAQIWIHIISHYGYPGLALLLALGIVGLPIPDEFLLTYTGFLVHKKVLTFFPAVISAMVGSSVGITLSYLLGRFASQYLTKKFGSVLRLTPERLESVRRRYRRFGVLLLTFGYFIAGLRHLTAFVAGASKLDFRTFAIFAYLGALLWSSTFIVAGFYLGEDWHKIVPFLHKRVYLTLAILGFTFAVVYLLYKFLPRKKM